MSRRIGLVAVAAIVAAIAGWRALRYTPDPGVRDRPGGTTPAGALPAGIARDAARRFVPGPVDPAMLESGLRSLTDAERDAPRARWDPAYVAARLRRDPEALLEWVRFNTWWVPYRGVLRGARGVLLDRQGNSLDRALLLSAMLASIGQEHRLAHATLPREQAEALLPRLLARRPRYATGPRADGAPVPDAAIGEAMAMYGLDASATSRFVDSRASRFRKTMELLAERTADQSARLLEIVGGGFGAADWRERADSAVEILRDHWWVQIRRGGEWVDLDPDVVTPASGGRLAATETRLPGEGLDSTLHHRITVRLVAERWSGSAFSERVVLTHGMRSSDSIGRTLELRILPQRWPAVLYRDRAAFTKAFREAALEQTEWRATLLLAGRPVGDVVLDATGAASHPAAGGPMGGLGRGIVGALGGTANDGALTALRLEYELRAPGRPVEKIRRTLFDVAGDSARAATPQRPPNLDESARLRRSLALLRSTEILPLPAALAPEFVLHLTAEGILRNGDLLRAVAADTLGSRGRGPSDVPAPAPLPSYLHALALARFEGSDTADVYLARPNILSRHTYPVVTPTGFGIREATDIVANEVEVDLGRRNAFAARLRQGVLDTNAEALLPATGAAFGAVAEAFARGRDWIVVDSATAARRGDPVGDVAHRMLAERRAGYLVVAPVDAVRATDELTGWWRIDPRTGHTLGVGATGWGQSLAERAAVAFVATFWFDYLICRGTFVFDQGPPSPVTLTHPPPFPLSLVPPLSAQEREPCSVDALVSAFVAAGIEIAAVTWPLVLRTIAGKGYSGLFSERPWFASGDAAPGEPPPIFGNKPGANSKPPSPDCPPSGVTEPPSGRPPEAGEPEPAPTSSKRGGAAEPGAHEGPEKPYYAEDGDGLTPVPPERMEPRLDEVRARRDAAEQAADEALLEWRKAMNEWQPVQAKADGAKARYDQLNRIDPHSEETRKAFEEYLTHAREANARANAVDDAERVLKRAEYEADLARYQSRFWNRLAAANRAAYEAFLRRLEAITAWQRTGMTNYDAPEYAQLRDATGRYRQVQRELADVYWNRESPPGGTDRTLPAPTEPAPGPGPAPGRAAAPPPAQCGGPVSPAAQSVGGAAAAGSALGVSP